MTTGREHAFCLAYKECHSDFFIRRSDKEIQIAIYSRTSAKANDFKGEEVQ